MIITEEGMPMAKRTVVLWGLCFALIISYIYYRYINIPVFKNQLCIGATYMTMNNNFYEAINDEVEKVVDLHNDTLFVRDPALNSEKQAEEIYDLAKKGCQALIINPVEADSEVINKALAYVKARGMKIIVVDSQLKDDSIVDCTIVSDNYDAGCQCAKDLMQSVDQARILILEHASALSAVDRIKGFEDTILNHPAYQIAARRDTQGQTEFSLKQVDEVIGDKIRFDAVMALNDPTALGALAAIKKNHLSTMPLVYGVDGSPDVKRLIANTQEIKGTSAQTPVTMGQKAVEVAYALLNGEEVEEKIVTEVFMITKENIDEYDISGWQ